MDKRFKILKKERLSVMSEARIIVDQKTGVNYLFFADGYAGGMTVLLDAEGKPVIGE